MFFCILCWEFLRSVLWTTCKYIASGTVVTTLYIVPARNWQFAPVGHLDPFCSPPAPHLWQPQSSLSELRVLFRFKMPHLMELLRSLSFSDRLISRSIMPSRSTHVVPKGRVSFLVAEPHSVVCVYAPPRLCALIHPSADTNAASMSGPSWVSLQRTRGCRYLFQIMSSFPSYKYQKWNC